MYRTHERQRWEKFPYSLNAKDLTEADERAKNLAEASGWLYYDLEVPLV